MPVQTFYSMTEIPRCRVRVKTSPLTIAFVCRHRPELKWLFFVLTSFFRLLECELSN